MTYFRFKMLLPVLLVAVLPVAAADDFTVEASMQDDLTDTDYVSNTSDATDNEMEEQYSSELTNETIDSQAVANEGATDNAEIIEEDDSENLHQIHQECESNEIQAGIAENSQYYFNECIHSQSGD